MSLVASEAMKALIEFLDPSNKRKEVMDERQQHLRQRGQEHQDTVRPRRDGRRKGRSSPSAKEVVGAAEFAAAHRLQLDLLQAVSSVSSREDRHALDGDASLEISASLKRRRRQTVQLIPPLANKAGLDLLGIGSTRFTVATSSGAALKCAHTVLGLAYNLKEAADQLITDARDSRWQALQPRRHLISTGLVVAMDRAEPIVPPITGPGSVAAFTPHQWRQFAAAHLQEINELHRSAGMPEYKTVEEVRPHNYGRIRGRLVFVDTDLLPSNPQARAWVASRLCVGGHPPDETAALSLDAEEFLAEVEAIDPAAGETISANDLARAAGWNPATPIRDRGWEWG